MIDYVLTLTQLNKLSHTLNRISMYYAFSLPLA